MKKSKSVSVRERGTGNLVDGKGATRALIDKHRQQRAFLLCQTIADRKAGGCVQGEESTD